MQREWIARAMVGQEELHLVLIEDLSPTAGSAENVCELMVNRHHLSRHRETIANLSFTDFAQAQNHCRKAYGVGAGDWADGITILYRFEFDYSVSNVGIPQPRPIESPDAKIAFLFSPVENENGHTRPGLNICGTREGLKRLAAMVLLCADSDQYDSEFHIHLADQSGVEADLDVTIRASLSRFALQPKVQ